MAELRSSPTPPAHLGSDQAFAACERVKFNLCSWSSKICTGSIRRPKRFLDSLIDSLPTARLLLLVNYRPEYQHGWGSKTYYTQLRIDPLPPESAEELLQALLGDDASLQPLKQLLIERTEGNPFFLEESIRTLVETKVLLGERGKYHLTGSFENTRVPATVQAVLAARIDRLSAEEKRLLQSAAVIGKDVPFVLLHAIADYPKKNCGADWVSFKRRSFSTRRVCFPISNTLSSMR